MREHRLDVLTGDRQDSPSLLRSRTPAPQGSERTKSAVHLGLAQLLLDGPAEHANHSVYAVVDRLPGQTTRNQLLSQRLHLAQPELLNGKRSVELQEEANGIPEVLDLACRTAVCAAVVTLGVLEVGRDDVGDPEILARRIARKPSTVRAPLGKRASKAPVGFRVVIGAEPNLPPVQAGVAVPRAPVAGYSVRTDALAQYVSPGLIVNPPTSW